MANCFLGSNDLRQTREISGCSILDRLLGNQKNMYFTSCCYLLLVLVLLLMRKWCRCCHVFSYSIHSCCLQLKLMMVFLKQKQKGIDRPWRLPMPCQLSSSPIQPPNIPPMYVLECFSPDWMDGFGVTTATSQNKVDGFFWCQATAKNKKFSSLCRHYASLCANWRCQSGRL